jgi:hypothetical protein
MWELTTALQKKDGRFRMGEISQMTINMVYCHVLLFVPCKEESKKKGEKQKHTPHKAQEPLADPKGD